MAAEEKMSVYRASRSIKRLENSLYNALRSIYEDATFVAEIAGLWRDLPLVANLRCGLWYSPRFEATCYFKSTDGHTNNLSFSTSRLNLHLAQLAGQKGGCIIVDSTRKGKRFPDSMSKTISIWACVLNRAIKNHLQRMSDTMQQGIELDSNISCNGSMDGGFRPAEWDCTLHLPTWVPNTEKAIIETHLEDWTRLLEDCHADISSLASNLGKPLRPLWISQRTLIWLNEVPEHDSWDFIPLILVSASGMSQLRTTSGFSWHYIPGAGDDEESWARGLSPDMFWKHSFELIDAGPDLCNRLVAEIVEKERVYHAHRGEYSPQVPVRSGKVLASNLTISSEESYVASQSMKSKFPIKSMGSTSCCNEQSLFWLGQTNIAVCATPHDSDASTDIDCVLNCDSSSKPLCFQSVNSYLHLPIMTSKVDRFSLIRNLSSAIDFAKTHLSIGRKLIVCCHNGEDISICVCLAILISLFDEDGSYDGGKSFMSTNITKWDVKRRLVFICKFAVNARPSRGNLKQVFGFLSKEQDSLTNTGSAVDST
ncbi:tRNA A64-2'-O-ribosylphosphate transferase-like isoform X1 [Zingiber officinale]|uniref:tRNA A64-2'-O-ribosylphosphate transferase-like isoform X1 n=1 Tax=Zingiber officinale TaxID=94328 RepID=UPI001C4D7D3C|nr:tRNA A64-2'-O-ribosylphosphate transferase-like isoform X1 [Zingiber officinale]XP_042408326.1 tRNA A64-2'-O-ribosylphosphate transferase-like isoform X1 [Zingiber officinale]